VQNARCERKYRDKVRDACRFHLRLALKRDLDEEDHPIFRAVRCRHQEFSSSIGDADPADSGNQALIVGTGKHGIAIACER
jgi:hypothetical protein